jgi:hypothetical protein
MTIRDAEAAAAEGLVTQSDSGEGNDAGTGLLEDCFCCCAHILPTSHFSVDAPACLASVDRALLYGEPQKLVTTVYHPPRG